MTAADRGTRGGGHRRVRAVRLALVLVVLEAVGYFVGFLLAAGRLGQGGSSAVRTVSTKLLGLTVFTGRRDGNVTTIASAGWLLPALVALPLLAWCAVMVLSRRANGSRRTPDGW